MGWTKDRSENLKNNKAPGLNKVPQNDFKAINNYNLSHLLEFFKNCWLEETDSDEWYEVQIVSVPKSGDLSDPKKWCGFTLTDIWAKIFSSILCGCAFKIIKAHGVKYQFGSTSGMGCQDGRFTFKTLLHLRHNHNLPSWVAFSDLVKALHTSNHKLLISILAIYGSPPRIFLRSEEC